MAERHCPACGSHVGGLGCGADEEDLAALSRDNAEALAAKTAEVERLIKIANITSGSDVRIRWANGEVCESCSHELCTMVREQRTALAAKELELATAREEERERHALITALFLLAQELIGELVVRCLGKEHDGYHKNQAQQLEIQRQEYIRQRGMR